MEQIKLRYGNMYTHTHTHTHTQGGFIIEDIFVEGNAYRDGRLSIGDRILAIDGEDFTQKTLAQASLALCAPLPLMKLTVLRESFEDGETLQHVMTVCCVI